MEFERRRKEHYKEFEAVKLARKLIEEELLDEDDDVEEENYESTSLRKADGAEYKMECEQSEEQMASESFAEEFEAMSSNKSLASAKEEGRQLDADPQFPRDHPCYGRGLGGNDGGAIGGSGSGAGAGAGLH